MNCHPRLNSFGRLFKSKTEYFLGKNEGLNMSPNNLDINRIIGYKDPKEDVVTWFNNNKKSAVVCFIDICNSTGLSEQDKADYIISIIVFIAKLQMEVLKLNSSITDEEYQYKIVKSTGDGAMLVRLHEISDLPQSTIELCHDVLFMVESISNNKAPVRAAIVLGDNLVQGLDIKNVQMNNNTFKDENMPSHINDFDFWGIDVNKASRIESIAIGKQTLITKELADKIREEFHLIKAELGDVCALDTIWGKCNTSCQMGECAARPKIRLVNHNSVLSDDIGIHFSAKGINGGVNVFQVIKQDHIFDFSTHILSNYRFGSLVFMNPPAAIQQGNDSQKTKWVNTRLIPSLKKSFPGPKTVMIVEIDKTTFSVRNSVDRDEEAERKPYYNYISLLISTDFNDFITNMSVLAQFDSGTSLFSHTSSHPIFDFEDNKLCFNVCSMFKFSNNDDWPKQIYNDNFFFVAIKFGNQSQTLSLQEALETHFIYNPDVKGKCWVSAGHFDLIYMIELNNSEKIKYNDDSESLVETPYNKTREILFAKTGSRALHIQELISFVGKPISMDL